VTENASGHACIHDRGVLGMASGAETISRLAVIKPARQPKLRRTATAGNGDHQKGRKTPRFSSIRISSPPLS
jgi:hypothetical protein